MNMHRWHYSLHRVLHDIRRAGRAIIDYSLLLFLAAFPVGLVVAIFGDRAGDAFVWALILAWVLSVVDRRRRGGLPPFLRSPSGRRLAVCYAALAVAILLGAILNPNA